MLRGYIPEDVWIYVHGVQNPERAWLDKEWAEVFNALKASGIDRDITSLIFSALSDEDRTEAQTTLGRWAELVKGVRWGDLIAQEVTFAGLFAEPPASREYFLLTRGKAGSADANMLGLVALLKELAALTDEISFSKREMGGVSVWSLTLEGAKSKEFPFSLEIFRKGEIIGFVSGRKPLERVVGLLTGKSEKPAIVTAPRFKEALGLVKSPEDFVLFFDGKSFASDLKRLMATARECTAPYRDGKSLKVMSAAQKMLDLCNVMDYLVLTMETDGRRELTHQATRLQPARKKCALACCFLDRKPFKRFDRFIPAEATGFSVNGFVDLEGLYKVALDFVKNELPNDEDLIGKWTGTLASFGFNPQRDFFSWWSGEMISVTLPAAVVTPMGGSDWVRMVRVKNAQLASQKIDSAISFVNGLLQGKGQMLMVAPAAVNAEGFRQVTYPMFAMWFRPVIGVKDEWLMIGSSPSAINKCLDVAAGKAPSIVTNDRFKKEGLIPEGPVLSASFRDTSDFGQELGQVVAMLGMFGGIGAGMIPGGPETDNAKKVIQKLATAIMKLGPVLQKIDFYSSESCVTTHDGSGTIITEKVVTYKPPTSSDVKTANAN